MASFLDKLKIKTAVDTHTKLDLSCNHISTADFMQLNVAWKKELVPGEKIKVNMETLARLAPMPCPTFGRGNINNRAFFVPFRTIFPGWNDFITDTSHITAEGQKGLINKVTTIRNNDLVTVFTNPEFATVSAYNSNVKYDYVMLEEGAYSGIRLTVLGRQVMKILNSLGYKIVWNNRDTTEYSALPLLALVKVYYDWYFPSAYANTGLMATIESILKMDVIDYTLTETEIFDLLAFIPKVNYDSDYFVSAWDNPVNPNSGSFSAVSMLDPTNGSQTTYNRVIGVSNFDGTNSTGSSEAPIIQGGTTISTGASLNALSQFAVDALKSLTDYMKRHQLVGARALDRYLARFGVNLPAEKLNRSVYLGSNIQPLQFNDVWSTASTDKATLGDYAGKGISYGSNSFDYETDEYGIMIIVSSIVPVIGYYQGIDRNNRHISKLDYWTPEFDNLGTQAISADELFVPTSSYGFTFPSDNRLSNRVFGFTPRYAEYKVCRDNVTGDLIYNSLNAGADSWHLMRELEYTSYADIVHNMAFVQGNDSGQYNRIFNSVADAESPWYSDKFNVIYNFNIVSISPMKSLFDTYDFDSHGKTVTEDVNGVKMN